MQDTKIKELEAKVRELEATKVTQKVRKVSWKDLLVETLTGPMTLKELEAAITGTGVTVPKGILPDTLKARPDIFINVNSKWRMRTTTDPIEVLKQPPRCKAMALRLHAEMQGRTMHVKDILALFEATIGPPKALVPYRYIRTMLWNNKHLWAQVTPRSSIYRCLPQTAAS